jgi:hypothetical protein
LYRVIAPDTPDGPARTGDHTSGLLTTSASPPEGCLRERFFTNALGDHPRNRRDLHGGVSR